MKKIFFVFVMLLAGITTSFAQRPFMRDTIRGTEPTYFYQYWLDSAGIKYMSTTDSCTTIIDSVNAHAETAKYNYTDSTLRVVGVAAVVATHRWPYDVADSSFDNWYEYMRLYKHADTGMTMLAEKTFTVLDTARWMQLYEMRGGKLASFVFPVYEAYFDHPVTVTDSFYVSFTNHNGCQWNGFSSMLGNPACPVHYYPAQTMADFYHCYTHCYSQHTMCLSLFAYDTTCHGRTDWYLDTSDCIYFIFPIIDTTQPLPDTCSVATNLQLEWIDSSSLHLSWTRGRYNHSWLVAYGLPGDSYAYWTLIETAEPSALLTDLSPDQEYAVCVRAICADTIHYSDWSDTLRFVPSSLGIREADGTVDFTLSPNPTDGRATVTLSGNGCAHALLTVTNAEGKELLRETMTGDTYQIDNLPAGLYFVKVSCDSFSKVKKLVVK